jgi:hypothetical protein
MTCVLANSPNWIEAIAALAIVGLTYLTLAADTKTIANASLLQTENAQKPFLVLLLSLKKSEYTRAAGL